MMCDYNCGNRVTDNLDANGEVALISSDTAEIARYHDSAECVNVLPAGVNLNSPAYWGA